jgi:predicted nucleic acid-binding Zn ribbon protein
VSDQEIPNPAPEPSGVDLARVALRAAKEQARARGAAAQQKKQARRGGLRSGARADGRDPLPLGAAINRLITERGWEAPAAVGGVMGRWPQLVGAALRAAEVRRGRAGAHRPVRFHGLGDAAAAADSDHRGQA